MIVMTASNFTVAYLLYPMWLIENDSPYIFETLCMTTFLVAGLMAERERQTILVLYVNMKIWARMWARICEYVNMKSLFNM